jgi:hypothetical protein
MHPTKSYLLMEVGGDDDDDDDDPASKKSNREWVWRAT